MDRQSRRSLRKEFLLAPEGTVFLLGCLMLVGWVGAIVLLWQFDHPTKYSISAVTFPASGY